jgi:DNA-binding NarL/FixJ family response regulator
MPRILLIESQPILRHGLRNLLGTAITGCEFGEAGTGFDGIQKLQAAPWDLAITQIALPDVHWVDLIRRMKTKAPKTPILAFCRYPEEQYGTRCIKLGASGYLSKSADTGTIVEVVKQVLGQHVYISPKIGEQFAREASHQSASLLHEDLSNREYEIFRMLTEGKSCTDIGIDLNLSVKTVSTYRKRILDKMGMKSNADLTHYAASIGLLY